MDVNEFLGLALEPDAHLRKGQKLMNMLFESRPDLYDQASSQDVSDVFYDDAHLWSMVGWIVENW